MKKRVSALWVFATAAGISLVLISGLRAHSGARAPVYDFATETAIQGTITETPEHTRMGLQLRIETKDGPIDVCLGPSRFIAAQGFSFDTGELVEVTGSRIMKAGAPILVAREVIKGGKTLVLRDHGTPLWSRGPR